MSCKNVKKLCEHLVISTGVRFGTTNLIITLPEGTYLNNEKYCIIIAQPIPEETTIAAPVVFRIGTSTVNYPLVNCDCSPVRACSVNFRTRYSTKVVTNGTSGSFKLLGRIPCSECNNNNAESLPIE